MERPNDKLAVPLVPRLGDECADLSPTCASTIRRRRLRPPCPSSAADGLLGLVPSESSSGGRTRRGGITKAGDHHARRVLIEGAWTYRYVARLSRGLHARNAGPARGRCAPSPGRRSCACAADTDVSPPAASPRSWSRPLSPATWPGSSGRSPAGCRGKRLFEPLHSRQGRSNEAPTPAPMAEGRPQGNPAW